jgi:hypothetical protein
MASRLKTLRENQKGLVEEIRRELRAERKMFPVVYLPNPDPPTPAEFVFVTMEPSLDRWAQDEHEAQKKVDDDGFRGFLLSWEDFLFHYAAENYLARPYVVTDLSKAAMKVKHAEVCRKSLYPRWLPLLKEEIEVVGVPGCRVVPVGNVVDAFLRKNPEGLHLCEKVLHYSPQAGKARKEIPESPGHQSEYLRWQKTVNAEGILDLAKKRLKESNMGLKLQEEINEKLKRNPTALSPSRLQLLYSYKVLFGRLGSNDIQAL